MHEKSEMREKANSPQLILSNEFNNAKFLKEEVRFRNKKVSALISKIILTQKNSLFYLWKQPF